MWHRGDLAKARDLFDLCAVSGHEPEAMDVASAHIERHAEAFLKRLDESAEVLEVDFKSIPARTFRMPSWGCLTVAHAILEPLISQGSVGSR